MGPPAQSYIRMRLGDGEGVAASSAVRRPLWEGWIGRQLQYDGDMRGQ
jgi:hypothetical protein